MKRSPILLQRKQTGLVVVDMQEKLVPVMAFEKTIVTNVLRLIRAFQILQLPVFATEQNPEKLGPTIESVKTALGATQPTGKMTFSCCGEDNFVRSIRQMKIQQIVLCGIETHVCIWQTAMDLLYEDFMPVAAGDALSSRREFDHRIALDRMKDCGIHIASTEMILFELLEKAGTDEFRGVQALIK